MICSEEEEEEQGLGVAKEEERPVGYGVAEEDRDANGAGGRILEFLSPSPFVNAIPISVPFPAAGIIFFPSPPRWVCT